MITFFRYLLDFLLRPKVVIPVIPETREEPPTPVPTPVPPVVPIPHLDAFCTAIRDFEGKPGDQNYRLHNPGNVRCSAVGYLAKYGKVTCVNGFACFETYELGWEYLKALVTVRAHLHPYWTISDFFYNYAPPADNNPTEAYAKYVAAHCGLTINTPISQLLT